MDSPIITGTQIAYYNICHRKLWLFSKNISMEHTSEFVEIGKMLHEYSYSRKKKEINLEGIKIDFIDTTNGIIHEIKKSKKLDESHHWQIKYYLFYFKKLGINVKGMIDYPKLKRREYINLTNEDEEKLKVMLEKIKIIINNNQIPGLIKKPYCKKCSYYDFCYC
jgi:CRISPR-associated exonuclease Cas4